MKKPTLISLGIFLISTLIIQLDIHIIDIGLIKEILDFLIAISLFLFFIFLIAWQAERGRIRLILTTAIIGLVALSFMVYGFIKADELEKALYHSNDQLNETRRPFTKSSKSKF